MVKVTNVFAREILDSRGNPTVEVELETDSGIRSRSMVPSGASTGVHEALELRDGDMSRFGGKGVLTAVQNVRGPIAEAIIGMDIEDQKGIDDVLLALDGTENKSKLGANAILGASMASMRAAALVQGKELFEYIGALSGNSEFILPTPMMNIINGGKHADSGLDIQEFMIVPVGPKSFREALRMGAEIFHTLKGVLKNMGMATGVGDEGGYAPNLPNNKSAFEVILKAIEKAGYKPGDDVMLAIDAAASEFYDENKGYLIDGNYLSSSEINDFYAELINKFPLILLEDGLAEDDWDGWVVHNEMLGEKVQLVADDLLVTNPIRLQKAIDMKAANAILIKLNQIGSVSETLETVANAKNNDWNCVISHRSGETIDSTIADLAVGVASKQIKTGSLCRSERVEKYNRLLRIEEYLGDRARYDGLNAF